ncbi:glucokinase, partial [Aeromonas jandaei]
MEQHILVGDIGGTNVRLALSCRETGELSAIKTYLCADYSSLTAVVQAYGESVGGVPKDACLAIAGPVQSDHVSMTNLAWEISSENCRKILGMDTLQIINDFTALSLSIPVLSPDDKIQIGNCDKAEPQTHKPIVVYGPGTGLGVAHLGKVRT